MLIKFLKRKLALGALTLGLAVPAVASEFRFRTGELVSLESLQPSREEMEEFLDRVTIDGVIDEGLLREEIRNPEGEDPTMHLGYVAAVLAGAVVKACENDWSVRTNKDGEVCAGKCGGWGTEKEGSADTKEKKDRGDNGEKKDRSCGGAKDSDRSCKAGDKDCKNKRGGDCQPGDRDCKKSGECKSDKSKSSRDLDPRSFRKNGYLDGSHFINGGY